MADESFLSGMGCNEKSSRDCERELETGKFGKYKKKQCVTTQSGNKGWVSQNGHVTEQGFKRLTRRTSHRYPSEGTHPLT